MSRKRDRSYEGFTLIELLVVIVILGILSAVVVFAVAGVKDKGAKSASAADKATLRTAEEAYLAKNGRYGSEGELVSGGFLATLPTLDHIQLTSNDVQGPGACPVARPLNCAFTIVDEPTATVNVAANADSWIVSDTNSGPGYHSAAYAYTLNSNIYDPLVIMGSNYSLQPGLALSWELIPRAATRTPLPVTGSNPAYPTFGGKADRPYDTDIWRFHLRQGVTWHDGTPFTADDVIWTWRDRQPINAANLTTVTNSLGFRHKLSTTPDQFDSVEKIDNFTVDFTPKIENLRLVEQIVHPKGAIVPVGKHFDGSTGGLPAGTKVYNDAAPGSPIIPASTPLVLGTPIGSGPFKFLSYAPTSPQGGGTASTVINDAYWGTRAQVKQMNYTFISDAATRTAGLLSGQYDMAIDLDALAVSSVNGSGGHVVTAGYGQNALLYVNKVVKDTPASPASPPAAAGTPGNYRYNFGTDPAVRKAVSLAIDRTTYVNSIYGGNALVGRYMAPPGILGPYANLVPALAFDAPQARTVLDSAGWTCGGGASGAGTACGANETRVHVSDGGPYTNGGGGRPLRLDLIGSPDVPQAGYDLLTAQMKSVGIDLHATRAACNATPCAGVARSQMYATVMWDLDLELPNQNDANAAFLPVLRMACLATNGNFRFAPPDGVNGVKATGVADTVGNGGGSFPFGNNPCNLNGVGATTSPLPVVNDAGTQGSLGPFDNVFVPASNVAATQDASQNAAAQMMHILVNQDQTNVVIPVTGQYRIYGMKGNLNLGDPHPSQTSQRWVSLTKT